MIISDKYKDEKFLSVIKDYELDDLIDFSKTVRVLYVGQDSKTRNDILGVFKIFFVDIHIASTGLEALELFQKNRYDLIITSTNLTDLNCIDFLTQIRNVSRRITILALSEEEKYLIDLIRLGIDGYVLIPIEINQFIEIMKKVITTLLDKEQLYTYRISLENLVEEKTFALNKLNNELEENIKIEIEKNREKDIQLFEQNKLAQMGEMIGNIAHQWRQPLSAISSTASSIELDAKLDLLSSEEIDKKMKMIVDKTNYLSKTIEIFRNFIDTKNKELKSVNISTEITNAIEIFHSSSKEIEIKYKLNDKITIETLEASLTQVLLSLLNNSKDAIIERKIDNPYIEIKSWKDEKNIFISVEDNAKGIDESILSKIFDPYFTTKHQSQGTGLGLHISYKIVNDNLKGNIKVKNTPKGAIFTIEIPLN